MAGILISAFLFSYYIFLVQFEIYLILFESKIISLFIIFLNLFFSCSTLNPIPSSLTKLSQKSSLWMSPVVPGRYQNQLNGRSERLVFFTKLCFKATLLFHDKNLFSIFLSSYSVLFPELNGKAKKIMWIFWIIYWLNHICMDRWLIWILNYSW